MTFDLHPQIALKAIPCSLAPSSEQLLTIRIMPGAIWRTTTNYKNIMFYDRYLFSVKKSDHNRTNMQAKIRYKLRLDDVRSSPSNCLESYSMQPGECATLVAFISWLKSVSAELSRQWFVGLLTLSLLLISMNLLEY